MITLPPFPTDDGTLDMLMAAIDPWSHGHPEATSSSLWPFLEMMSRLGGSQPEATTETEPVIVLRDPLYHEHDIITALVAEIRHLRGKT